MCLHPRDGPVVASYVLHLCKRELLQKTVISVEHFSDWPQRVKPAAMW